RIATIGALPFAGIAGGIEVEHLDAVDGEAEPEMGWDRILEVEAAGEDEGGAGGDGDGRGFPGEFVQGFLLPDAEVMAVVLAMGDAGRLLADVLDQAGETFDE